MTYLHLLSPTGEPFEILEPRVGKLLLEGWTFNPAPLKTSDAVFTAPVEESNGTIADAQEFAVDVPVADVEDNAPVDAGPVAEEQQYAAVQSEDEEKPRGRGRRPAVTNDE